MQQCCGNGWWKSDSSFCYMVSGNIFQPDCDSRVTTKLNTLPACVNPGAMTYEAVSTSAMTAGNSDKIFVLGYNIKEDIITLTDAVIVQSIAPNYFAESGRFTVRELALDGSELMRVMLGDPREFRFGNQQNFEQGMMMGDDVDFLVVMPFRSGTATFEIIDNETGEKVHEADVIELIIDFCEKVNYMEPECQFYPIRVPVDIKPLGCPNPLNVEAKANEVLPVAVLGTATLDISKIDPSSVRLEGIAPVRYALKDVATPFTPFTRKTQSTDCTSAGPDGILDLTLKFDIKSLITALGPINDGEVRVLHLTGYLRDGTSLVGEDVVIILQKK